MKSIDRTAYVARTAEGLTHSNRLAVPEFGVVELRLFKGAASSQSHRLPRSKTPRDPAVVGDDNFHFAPGPQLDPGPWTIDAAREDRVTVRYHLYNPFGAAKKARLELFVRNEKSAVWHRDLKDAELFDGERALQWKIEGAGGALQDSADWDGSLRNAAGALQKSSRFPDGFLTTEHSPYKFKLTVEGDAMCRSPAAWTYVHVLVDKLELEWGTIGMLPTKRDHRRELFQDVLTRATAPTADQRIHMLSNIFMADAKEMFKNKLYDEYNKRWGKGAKLPLCAKVFVRSSADAAVLAPRALGSTRFLWDWESRSAATGPAFVDQATNYDIDDTKPKGRNCHKDRGGKRGDGGAVFPSQSGYDPPVAQDGKFPFKVVAWSKPRPWAAYTTAWREGVFACKTGVVFQPARMAGDKYRVTVYAAHERNAAGKLRLDVDTDAPLPIQAVLKATSGEFEIWRRIELRRYMQKSNFGAMNLAAVSAFYEPAFVELLDKTGGAVETYPAGEWNATLGGIIGGWSAFENYFVDPAVDQHAGGAEGVIFRTRDDAKLYLIATFPGAIPDDAAAEAWLLAQGMGAHVDADGNAVTAEAAYANRLSPRAVAALQTLFNAKIHADDGLDIFHVARSANVIEDWMGTLVGLAHNFPAATPKPAGQTRCGFLMMADAPYYALRPPETVEQTAAHECGHHFMLPHPRNTAENRGANANRDYKAHDSGVTDCLMSYNAVVRSLCGFCQLRLRGWNKTKLKVDGAQNEKT